MSERDYLDISGKIGPLYERQGGPEWPMYSYDRPAYMLWNAIATELHSKGWTDEEIKDWLQSKYPRWALDGDLGESIESLGQKFASRMSEGDKTNL